MDRPQPTEDRSHPRKRIRRLADWALVAALAGEVIALFYDIPILQSRSEKRPVAGQPIAELMSRHRSVQVQNFGELVWENTEVGQILYRQQSILTLEQSAAEIAFLDGTGITVGENSLVLLEKKALDEGGELQRIVVRLIRGSLHKREPSKQPTLPRTISARAPELEIRVGNGSTLVPPDAQLSLEASTEGTSRIEVHAGELQFHTSNGDLRLTSGQEAAINAADSQEAPSAPRPIALLPLFPRGGEKIPLSDSNDGSLLRFRVKNALPPETRRSLKLELSQDREFGRGVIRQNIPAPISPSDEINIPFKIESRATPPGLWYWRVNEVGKNPEISSPTESFWLNPSPQPETRLPIDGAQLRSGVRVDFLWSEIEGSSRYELDLRTEDGESAPPIEERSDSPTASLGSIAPGRWRWRVRAALPDGTFSQWSRERRFTIEASAPKQMPQESLPPPPDELTDGEVEPRPTPTPSPSPFSWMRLDWLISSALAQDSATNSKKEWSIRLKWKPVKGIKKYRVQISRKRDFKDVITEVQADQPEWVWNYQAGMENTKGRVFYRVASVSESGKVGTYSKPKAVPISQKIGSTRNLESPKEMYSAMDPAEEATPPKPAPSPSPSPPPMANPLLPEPAQYTEPNSPSVTAPEDVEPGFEWNGSAGIFIGYGNLEQSTDSSATLASVQMDSPFFQQQVQLSGELPDQWRASASFAFSGFKGAPSERPIYQPEVNAWSLRVNAFREKGPNLSLGITFDRSYRWVKTGPQSVEPDGALSIGPVAALVYQPNGDPLPSEAGVMLALPITGALSQGYMGAKGKFWAEWKLVAIKAHWIGLKTALEADFMRWSGDSPSSVTSWTFWLAPTFHFGGGAQ